MAPQPSTPQSLKRKLQEIPDLNESGNLNSPISSPSLRSPPTELFLPSSMQTSPTRSNSVSSSPTRSIRTANIIHSTVSVNSTALNLNQMTPLQLSEMHKLFTARTAPFPLELLKPSSLAEIFLKGRALEGYFQRRLDGIPQDSRSGLRPLSRPFIRSSPPSVPFSVYLERLFRYAHPEPLHLLAIVAYSERLIKSHNYFVTPLGWHRFTVAAWIVGAKALIGDQYWTNPYWARVAGISVPEICALEAELIEILQWRLQIPLSELTAAWYLIQL